MGCLVASMRVNPVPNDGERHPIFDLTIKK